MTGWTSLNDEGIAGTMPKAAPLLLGHPPGRPRTYMSISTSGLCDTELRTGSPYRRLGVGGNENLIDKA